jgi:Ca2+:H+ antiporter
MLFDPFESIALFLAGQFLGQSVIEMSLTHLSVITVNYVVQDGKSNWLEGIILMGMCCFLNPEYYAHWLIFIALYVILGTTFFFYPGTSDEFSSILPQCH